ncbi:MAG: thiamine-phosphate kinase, partial [Pseudomonadota bacterium]
LNTENHHQLVASTDSMVEGRHFLASTEPYLIGQKLMAVNLSDMAAMGARPKWITLNLTLPSIKEDWLSSFADGFCKHAKLSQVSLVGGDLTRGTELNVSAQILGEVPTGQSLLRSGADENDQVYVTGMIGGAGSALSTLLKHEGDHSQLSEHQIKALYQPTSRVELGIELRDYATAAIDVSDGLLHDLELLCQASQVGADLGLDAIPVDKNIDCMDAIITGDDYELIFTAPEKFKNAINALAKSTSCPITSIGKLNQNSGCVNLFKDNKQVSSPKVSGFDHFENQS